MMPGEEVCVGGLLGFVNGSLQSLNGNGQKFQETRAATYSRPLKPEVVAQTSPPATSGQAFCGVVPFGPHAGGWKFIPFASVVVCAASTVFEIFHFVGEPTSAHETSWPTLLLPDAWNMIPSFAESTGWLSNSEQFPGVTSNLAPALDSFGVGISCIASKHSPAVHFFSFAQLTPQAPQLCSSFTTSTHFVPQATKPGSQAQWRS